MTIFDQLKETFGGDPIVRIGPDLRHTVYSMAELTPRQIVRVEALLTQHGTLFGWEKTFTAFAKEHGVGRSTMRGSLSNAGFRLTMLREHGTVVHPNGRRKNLVDF